MTLADGWGARGSGVQVHGSEAAGSVPASSGSPRTALRRSAGGVSAWSVAQHAHRVDAARAIGRTHRGNEGGDPDHRGREHEIPGRYGKNAEEVGTQ